MNLIAVCCSHIAIALKHLKDKAVLDSFRKTENAR